MLKKVLIVYHSQTGNTKLAAEFVAEGVRSVKETAPIVKKAPDAGPEELIAADAVCLGSPDYFGYMSGIVKDFFDRTFYPTQGKLDNKPCGIFVTHGGGGTAAKSIEQLCRAFRLQQLGKSVLVKDKPDKASQEALRELGIALAKSIAK
ncbi:MAG: NAD(P)H-dependent oxidoreductase [Planctomycetes bacterium]|nr:NAD(P)H-dependent oxidoreductase [Planctomycetota bacterium]